MKYIIVFIGLFFSLSLISQDVETNTSESNEQEIVLNTQEQEKPSEQDENEIESEPGFDVFRPSEDISEDLAVPFPVDI